MEFDSTEVRSWLSGHGLKQTYVARLLHVNPRTLRAWLAGRWTPTPEHVNRLYAVMRQYDAMKRRKN